MQSELAKAWGSFLSRYPWDWFLTLTFREPVPSFRAYRIFSRFCRDVQRAAGHPIAWFRGDEYGPRGGRLHFHVLMLNVAHLRRLTWMDEWDQRAGWARIEEFDRTKGAAYYCAKYVAKGFGEWELEGLPIAYQPILPIPASKISTRQRPLARAAKREVSSSGSLYSPQVRRARPKKQCTQRRDWEAEMLRRSERWKTV